MKYRDMKSFDNHARFARTKKGDKKRTVIISKCLQRGCRAKN